ncbi:Hypothetical_protein [Hexamita inflata]|uniref:Hypothetical_protein n=1 Tax=Hexamita inflata TaxID=28002 RepID=A0AA86R6K3_9EUKA|nr:Hypothetical protein HINF_LOCUS58002 [Hexamita inflata]
MYKISIQFNIFRISYPSEVNFYQLNSRVNILIQQHHQTNGSTCAYILNISFLKLFTLFQHVIILFYPFQYIIRVPLQILFINLLQRPQFLFVQNSSCFFFDQNSVFYRNCQIQNRIQFSSTSHQLLLPIFQNVSIFNKEINVFNALPIVSSDSAFFIQINNKSLFEIEFNGKYKTSKVGQPIDYIDGLIICQNGFLTRSGRVAITSHQECGQISLSNKWNKIDIWKLENKTIAMKTAKSISATPHTDQNELVGIEKHFNDVLDVFVLTNQYIAIQKQMEILVIDYKCEIIKQMPNTNQITNQLLKIQRINETHVANDRWDIQTVEKWIDNIYQQSQQSQHVLVTCLKYCLFLVSTAKILIEM